MKYVALVPLLFLAACTGKPADKNYICINPFMSLQGIYVGSDTPELALKERPSSLEITDGNGVTIVIPRGLCAEVRKAK
jgi:hypothetical protein